MTQRRKCSITTPIKGVLLEADFEKSLKLEDLQRGMFVSWLENEHWATAVVTDDRWFDAAVNCWRDSQMGEIDPDGYPERIWYSDGIKITDDFKEQTLRAATLREVVKYLDIVELTDVFHGETLTAIVFDIEQEVFYAVTSEKPVDKQRRPILHWCGRNNQ